MPTQEFCNSFPEDATCPGSIAYELRQKEAQTQAITEEPVMPPAMPASVALPWWLLLAGPIAVVFAVLQHCTKDEEPWRPETPVWHGVADLPRYQPPQPLPVPTTRRHAPPQAAETHASRGEIPVSEAPQTAETLSPPCGGPSRSPFDIAAYMADNLGPTLVTATPRTGKGIVLSRFWRLAKQKGVSVWVIQPKPAAKELGYWQGVDRFLPIMLEDYDVNSADVADSMRQFIRDWRAQQHRPTILIIDELVKIQACQPKFYEWLKSQVLVEMSSGETDQRYVYLVTQSPLVGDIGLSGGNRAILNLLALARKDKSEHLNSLCASLKSVSKPDSSLYEASQSPTRSVAYHSSLNRWYPMPCYDVPQMDPALNAFVQWKAEQGGEVSYEQFKNANAFKQYSRSRSEFDRLVELAG